MFYFSLDTRERIKQEKASAIESQTLLGAYHELIFGLIKQHYANSAGH